MEFKDTQIIKKDISQLSTYGLPILAILAIGCGSNNPTKLTSSLAMTAGNKPANVVMSVPSKFNLLIPKAVALIPNTIVDSTGLSIALSKSWIVVKEIELMASETRGAGEVDGSEVSFKGPYFIDLLNNAPVNIDSGAVSAAPYKRIKMKLEKAGGALVPTGAPAALSGNSIYMAGTIGTGGTAVNFTYQSDDGTEYQIGGTNPVSPADGGRILVEINFSNIFKQINMSTVLNNEIISSTNRHTGVNLCPNIDVTSPDIFTCVRKGLEKHGSVGEDVNKTGSLDVSSKKVK